LIVLEVPAIRDVIPGQVCKPKPQMPVFNESQMVAFFQNDEFLHLTPMVLPPQPL
jgi:hypothetical protein